MISKRILHRGRSERGQAMLEFLMILPVFLVLVFGMVEFGKGFMYWVDMTHLAGEGGRYASVSWFPGCSSDSNVTGPCSGNATLQTFISGSTDLQELASSSNPGSPADPGCVSTPQAPSPAIKGEVPCKLQVSYCYPQQGTGVTSGTPGSALRISITSTYRLKLVNAILSFWKKDAGEVHLTARSTVRLERQVDPARLGVAGIQPCS